MMRKKYISVEVEAVALEGEDVICTSGYEEPKDHVIFGDRFD